MTYLNELDAYARDLEDFIAHFALPDAWFAGPDHVAVKCADKLDYEDVLEELKEDAERISDISMHNRRLATVELLSSVAFGEFGDVRVVEVMEPRPEKVGSGIIGFEHAEFYYPDFSEVRNTLRDRSIPFEEPDDNDEHQCIVVVINEKGQEIKFNNRGLAEIASKQLQTGESTLIK